MMILDQDSEEAFLTAIKLAPNFGEAHLNIAAYYYSVKQEDKAIYHLSKVDNPKLNIEKEKLSKLLTD